MNKTFSVDNYRDHFNYSQLFNMADPNQSKPNIASLAQSASATKPKTSLGGSVIPSRLPTSKISML